jgi:precorrin-6Y C5,15-methyltransferase (decarboxylating)
MTRWLSIVGIGEDGLDGLGQRARALVDEAEVLVGGDRHLAMIPDDGRRQLAWPSPLTALIDTIVGLRGTPVCVLATGDPLYYGVGVTLARHVTADEMTIVPGPSAFALACARMGWPRAETETLTLHGRPLSQIHPYVYPGARLVALSEGAATPAGIAAMLVERGHGASRMTVLEHMGGPKERLIEATAATWTNDTVAEFNTLAIECVADHGAPLLPRVPGLPDDAFIHDGQLTKREVRATTLAALGPVPGQHLWDIGAGSGAIGIEWMRAHFTCRATAVEHHPGRLKNIRANAEALGVPKLAIVEGKVPDALAGLEAPDAIFIGGGLAQPGIFASCWDALSPGGRLAANAVTLEGEIILFDCHEKWGGMLTRVSIAHAEPMGGRTGWTPLRTVTQYAVTKP